VMMKKMAASVLPISMSRSRMRSVFIYVQGVPVVQKIHLAHTSRQRQSGLW
jgi:hypothetical protein